MTAPTAGELPEIPHVDVGHGGFDALAHSHHRSSLALVALARRTYGRGTLAIVDAVSRRWAARAGLPYADEVAAVAAAVGQRGAWMLNLSYEWGCTTAVRAAPGNKPRMLRVLDWPLDGLGRHLVAARRVGAAGPWLNLTWPGFIGVLQAVAHGRFAAAFNQAPKPGPGWSRMVDWAWNRPAIWRSRAVPPAFLLRQVFDECATFAHARDRLATTPITVPAIYSLAGRADGEAAIIQRLPDQAVVTEGDGAITNHWCADHFRGKSWSSLTVERLAAMRTHLSDDADDGTPLAWLKPPILNPDTRVVMEADAATGAVTALGVEADGPVTRPLSVTA